MIRHRLLPLLLALALPASAARIAVFDAADLDGTTLRDASGADHHGQAVGVAAADEMGRQVLRFDSANAAVTITPPLGDGASALTIVAVVQVEAAPGRYQGVVCRDRFGGPTGDVYGLIIDPDGNWAARLVTTGGSAACGARAEPGWHQVALTYDGTRLTLSVDGAEVAAKPISGAIVSLPETPLALGNYSNGQGPLAGGLARVELSDEALDATQLATLWAGWQEAHPLRGGFWFAAASDIHITDTKSVEIVNDAVDAINADRRVAFSLWLGDLTRQAEPDEMTLARLTLQRLRRPWYTVRGNHDQAGGTYEQEFGPLCRAVDHGGWRFLLVDSNPGDDTPMSDEVVGWLRDQLAHTDHTMPLVLCSHHPLMPHTKAYHLAGAEDVLALFQGYNLKASLSGHYHGNQEEVVDGVRFTTTACLSTTRGNFDGTTVRGYRLFHCDEGRITSEFVPVRDVPAGG